MGELLYSPQRGTYKITDDGVKVLKKPPEKITIKFLRNTDKFSKNINSGKNKRNEIEDKEQEINEKTPDEIFELSYSQIIDNIKIQLKQKINK